MRVIKILSVTLILIMSLVTQASSAMPATKSLCMAGETVLFSCRYKSKTFSLCASRDLTAKTGYIQYRVGKGAKPQNILEMEFPKEHVPPQKIFKLELMPRGASVSFSNEGFLYTLASDLTDIDVVSVEKDYKLVSNFQCSETDANVNLTMTSIQKIFKSAGLGE